MGMHVNSFEGDTDDAGRVSPARVRAYFDYCPDTGFLTVRESRNKAMKAGSRAGSKRSHRAFREIVIDNHRFREARVVWAHITGAWPRCGYDIRHVNGVLDDCRQENLTEELVLRSLPRGTPNACGFVGVVPVRCRFAARLRVGRKEVHIGTFDTPEQAHEAWMKAALERQVARDRKARGYS